MPTPDLTTPFDFVTRDHFRPLRERQDAMRLFCRSVLMVEIEVFSYCNRRCWFCPNSVVDRHSGTEYMPESLYLHVLRQLEDARYEGVISYSRYNEPLADRIILRRLEQAHAALPHATLHTNTNGDYLTRPYLEELAHAGLRSLGIQAYLGNNERYDHERMRARLLAKIGELGLSATFVRDEPGTWLEATAGHSGMRIRLYARNFAVNGCNRGGSVPIRAAAPRKSPCLSPFYHVYIDYNGKVMPCCNLRSDIPEHADAIVGDLTRTPDLFLMYAGTDMAAWRRHLIGFTPKTGHCASCSFVPFDDVPALRAATDRWASEAHNDEETWCCGLRPVGSEVSPFESGACAR